MEVVALLVLVQLPVLTIKFVYAENAFIRYLCLILFLVIYIAFFIKCFQCYLWQAIGFRFGEGGCERSLPAH